jgi:peptidoglycan/LPS O-acetylase OafA/YrhL
MNGSSPAPSTYIPGLNALRVYAAFSVIVAHVHEFIPGWFLIEVNTGMLRQFTLTGTGAVTLFYVLSGFLLMSLLLAEKSRHHRIDVMKFYQRRIRRIVPLYYVVLAITVVVSRVTAPDYGIVFGRQFDDVQIPAAAAFAAFVPLALDSISGMFSHYWSLGVEMVFYLLAPWLAGMRRVPLALGVVIALRLLILALTPFAGSVHQIILYLPVDSLAIGALSAWLWHTHRPAVERTLTTLPARIGLAVAFAFLIVVEIPPHVVWTDTLMTLICAWLVVNIAAGHFVLENRLIRVLSNYTYGIYLWHMLALFVVGASGMAGVRVYVAVAGLALLLAMITYPLVERPFLRPRRQNRTQAANTLPAGIEGA